MIYVVPEFVSIVDKDFLSRAYLTRSVNAHPGEACLGAFICGVVGGESSVSLEL